ncbi:hypothetical protein IYY11_01280 [Methylocystis sp. H62]|uniref:hypothetical protein n=1 Tax=Methylocystis sp. H62 TaxID=2785789 RepID=UPI0018C1F59B|nr:hypothetical protein [Methylocystis sp. H62]MBG0792116.1 hypothetical protein [Methylocystis sp. H62]
MRKQSEAHCGALRDAGALELKTPTEILAVMTTAYRPSAGAATPRAQLKSLKISLSENFLIFAN